MVTPEPGQRRAIILVTADVGSTITLHRSSDSGAGRVRGAVDHLMDSAEALFADYELPQNTDVTYWAESVLGGVTETSVVVDAGLFDFGGDVLFDLSKPWAGMVVNVESFPQRDYDISRDVVNVWDRPDPVVVSGERQLPSGTLTLVTLEAGEIGAMQNTLFTGNIVAFSPWKPTYGLPGPAYYAIGRVSEVRTSPFALEGSRRWQLEAQQVLAPRSTYVYPTGITPWQQVYDDGTWQLTLDSLWLEVAGF
jgi:hypothetical protein